MDSTANQPEPSLREQMRVLHNRFHGRFETHAQVAKHSRWTPEELENVQIEDEEIYYSELAALFQAEKEAAVREAIVDAAIDEAVAITKGLIRHNAGYSEVKAVIEDRIEVHKAAKSAVAHPQAGEGEGK